MTVHLIKLCVGADAIEDLEAWQAHVMDEQRRAGAPPLPTHTTRQTPKRRDELLLGGSLYWVIKGVIQVRQRLLGVDSGTAPDGTKACVLTLDPELIPVAPRRKKPFQGWRYLDADAAPRDLGGPTGGGDLPARLRRELVELGAW